MLPQRGPDRTHAALAPINSLPPRLGWHWRFGAETAARAFRTWDRDGETLAVGLIDSPGLLRVGIAPGADQDDELARRMVSDVTQLLPEGTVSVEARCDGPFRTMLLDDGWHLDEPWTPFRRDLTEPVAPCGVRIEAIGPERAHVRVAVQRAAFDGSTFTDERWHAMAGGSPYADARCLVAHDDNGPRCRPRRCGRPVREGPDCSNRWACTATIAAAATAGRSPSPRRPPFGPGLVERDGGHPELQRRRRRDLPIGRLPTASRPTGPASAGVNR